MGVQEAAKAVQKRSSAMDGQLFLIKQLLILREQIAPFEADFSVVEKDLDFTHMRDHLRRILAGTLLSRLLKQERQAPRDSHRHAALCCNWMLIACLSLLELCMRVQGMHPSSQCQQTTPWCSSSAEALRGYWRVRYLLSKAPVRDFSMCICSAPDSTLRSDWQNCSKGL